MRVLTPRRVSLLALVTVLGLGLSVTVPSASAQTDASSVIQGFVKDGTGGTLPGVTVTLRSPALQVGQRVAVTGEDGSYRFGELPGGTYRLTFELVGFTTFVRDELTLAIGFTARVDAVMGVGQVEETVTVSGAAPVVDLTASGTATNVTAQTLQSVPLGRDIWMVMDMAAGVTRQGVLDVGGSLMASRPSMATYGVVAQPKLEVEGINIVSGGIRIRPCTSTRSASRRCSSRPPGPMPRWGHRASR